MPATAGSRRPSRFASRSWRWARLPPGRSWLGSLILVPAVVLLVALARDKSFGIDEFLHLHWGSEAAQGRFAGSDYFASHFALLQFVLAPLFLLLEPSSTTPLLAARGIALLLFLFTVAAALAALEPGAGSRRRLLAATLLVSTHVLIVAAVEVRPDLLSLCLLCCGAVLYLRTEGRWTALVAGLLLGGAILSSEKALLHGLAFAWAMALGLWRAWHQGPATRSDRWTRFGPRVPELARAGIAAGAVAAVLGAAVGALYAADGLHQFRVWLEFAQLHETAYPTERFAALKELGRVLAGAPFLVLAPVGAWHLARRSLRSTSLAESALREASVGRDASGGSERSGGARQALCDGFVVAAALAGLLSVLLQRAPYRYSSVPLLLFGTLLAVEGLGRLFGALRRWLPAAARGRGAVLAGGLLAVFLLGEFSKTVQEITSPEQTRQLAALESIFRLTAPGDCVYDNSAFAYSRRHVDDFFLMTDATMRMALRKELARRIPAAIRERQCTVFKDDIRTRDLPRSLQRFLGSHYLRVAPDLFLWGQRYSPAAPAASEPSERAGSARVSFEALAPGEYYLSPESAKFRSGGRTVTLPRGECSLEVVASGSFCILWRPRDGRTYPPLEEVPGKGNLSAAPEAGANAAR